MKLFLQGLVMLFRALKTIITLVIFSYTSQSIAYTSGQTITILDIQTDHSELTDFISRKADFLLGNPHYVTGNKPGITIFGKPSNEDRAEYLGVLGGKALSSFVQLQNT